MKGIPSSLAIEQIAFVHTSFDHDQGIHVDFYYNPHKKNNPSLRWYTPLLSIPP